MASNRIQQYFYSVLDLKPGEGKLVGLMFLYNFILLVTLYLLKPVRDSLFLVELGPQQLPYVFILTALAAVPVSMGYSRYSAKAPLSWVINGVTFFLSISLIAIWWLLSIDSPVLYYALYIWVSIYSILVTSQFWLLANALFRPVQAKRIFTLLSLAAIIGSIAGGEITGLLTDELHFAPSTLILVGAGLLLSTILLVRIIRQEAYGQSDISGERPSGAEETDNEFGRTLFGDILTSRHLLLITGIIGISVVTTTMIDYQFKTIASGVYLTDSSLTTFMGRFYGRVSFVALFFQLFLSSKFISRGGVGGAVALLPGMLLLGSVGLFIWPVLAAAVLLRGADQSLKHSVDRTGRELLFLPVGMKLKKRTKVFIDLFVDNGAQGLAGGLLLLFTLGWSLSVQYLSLVVIGLLICWIILVVWVRRTYINEFRQNLEEQVSETDQREHKQYAELSPAEMIDNLQSRDHTTVLQSLKALEQNYDLRDISIQTLKRLLGHPNPSVRQRTLHLFRTRGISGHMQEVARLLDDPSAAVRLEAARYLYHFYGADSYEGDWLSLLEQGLHHRDVRIRATTLGVIVRDGGEQERALITDELLERACQYRGEDAEELRIAAARGASVGYSESRASILKELLEDESQEVVVQAVISAGYSGDRRFVPLLLDRIKDKRYKRTVQKSLARYGRRILGTLFDYVTDEQEPLTKQLQIPYVLYLNQNQEALEVLQLALEESSIPVRHQVIKALNKIRRKIVNPVFNKEKLRVNVYREARRYALLSQSKLQVEQLEAPELAATVDEELSKSFENMFRLLGLIYDADDIYNVYKGIRSGEEALTSESIEFLDNLMDWEMRKDLMPLFESELTDQKEFSVWENAIRTRQEALQFLEKLPHPTLQEQLPPS